MTAPLFRAGPRRSCGSHRRRTLTASLSAALVTVALLPSAATASPVRTGAARQAPGREAPGRDALGSDASPVLARTPAGKVRVSVHAPTAVARTDARAAVRAKPCSAITPGPGSGTTPIPVALSAAHNVVREFAVQSAFHAGDDALAGALDRPSALTAAGIGAALQRYTATLPDTCALTASPARLPRARVIRIGDVAVVRPGTGPVRLPAGVTAGVIDLRGLPAVATLPAALDHAVSPFLATPVAGPNEVVRVNDGPADEYFNPTQSVYSTSVSTVSGRSVPATGAHDLPLAVLTGPRTAPDAARLAGVLRTARRAWLIGSDVTSAGAESTWRGVGRYGIAVRTGALDHVNRPRVSTVQQTIGQDDPDDPTTAGYQRRFTLASDVQRVEIKTTAAAGNDIDVYLLEDLDGNGTFSFPDELVAYSATTSPDEDAILSGLGLGGHYELIVHGFSVPAGSVDATISTSVQTGAVWPDVIRADLPRTTSPAAAVGPRDPAQVTASGRLTAAGGLAATLPPPVTGTVDRALPGPIDPSTPQPVTTSRAQLRAALIIAHGMVRRYWRYFNVQGQTFDRRLIETLADASRWNGRDRVRAFEILQRLGQALHDGHQYVVDQGPPNYVGYLPVFLDAIGGRPVVRTSTDPDLHPGDTIESIDGVSTRQLYAREYRLISTATTGYRFDVASRYISRMTGPETLVVAGPDGHRRSVLVQPVSREQWGTQQDTGVTSRSSGSLTDLDAPDLAYVSLNETSLDQIDAAITAAQAQHAKALVVDMREYPGAFYGYVAERFIDAPFLSTPFTWNHFDGPDARVVESTQDQFEPTSSPHWSGPIALLVGPHTVSAAESTAQMLVAYDHPVAIVGQTRSAGTTGDLTGIELPGGFAFSFTGLGVVNVDGSRFMGVGIRPTVQVPLTTQALAAGTDPDLVTAVNVLHSSGF